MSATICSDHGSSPVAECGECFKCFKSLLEYQQRTMLKFPRLQDIARQNIKIRNETASSSHTNTNHRRASHKHMEIPQINLPETFWDCQTEYKFPKNINGEPGVNASIMALIGVVTTALGLEDHIDALLDVPIIDTAADVAIKTDINKQLCGTVEGKKPPKTSEEREKIFGSGTDVAGEAFEQLFLTKIQTGSLAVGLISTLQTFQLISLEDIGTITSSRPRLTLTPTEAKEFFEKHNQSKESAVTPDRPKSLVDATETGVPVRKKSNLKKTGAPPKKKKPLLGETPKKEGRVSVTIKEAAAKREYFATDPISFGNDEAENRKVFELLAVYMLLCVESLKEQPDGPLDLTKENVRCLTREVRTDAATFAFKEIELAHGIYFDDQPKQKESVFYAIRQLGHGQNGVCCFACTTSCSPCVIKFFRQDHDFKSVEKEAELWKTLYGDLGFHFVKAYNQPRPLLIMPYLRVPCNLAERNQLVNGDENSLLYKALKGFAKKKHIHKEIFWHHVGLIEVSPPMQQNSSRGASRKRVWRKKSSSPEVETTTVVVICDLAHAEPCENKTECENWVKDSFNAMKGRMGEVSDQESVIETVTSNS